MRKAFLWLALSAGSVLSACRGHEPPADDTLILAGYSAPREALEQSLIPAFAARWRAAQGRVLRVHSSYLGSGAQTRAVLQGFEADVAILALETDMQKLADAKLVSADWKAATGRGGFVAHTPVVVAVRTGNPLGLHAFADLARPGLELLTPNPKTSGAAVWNLLAVYGAAALSQGAGSGDALVAGVLANVVAMDKGARESVVNFERGIGDAAITYEQEVIGARRAGRTYDEVLPQPTIVADIPAAVIDRYAQAHGRSAVAAAFVAFLQSDEGQRLLADYGFRPRAGVVLDPQVAAGYPILAPASTFTVEQLGGWKKVQKELIGSQGRLTRLIEQRGAYVPHALATPLPAAPVAPGAPARPAVRGPS